jgi:hypothetical protein
MSARLRSLWGVENALARRTIFELHFHNSIRKARINIVPMEVRIVPVRDPGVRYTNCSSCSPAGTWIFIHPFWSFRIGSVRSLNTHLQPGSAFLCIVSSSESGE